ncbi:MAG: hypothetical protein AVDCRST_MAG77-1375, partial [uncultured Chloroflexi bacterium]
AVPTAKRRASCSASSFPSSPHCSGQSA